MRLTRTGGGRSCSKRWQSSDGPQAIIAISISREDPQSTDFGKPVFSLVLLVEIAPVPSDMASEQGEGIDAPALHRLDGCGGCHGARARSVEPTAHHCRTGLPISALGRGL